MGGVFKAEQRAAYPSRPRRRALTTRRPRRGCLRTDLRVAAKIRTNVPGRVYVMVRACSWGWLRYLSRAALPLAHLAQELIHKRHL